MKYHWTEQDIICGKYVCKPRKKHGNAGWYAKWTFKIGYYCSGKKACLISMTDGAVTLRDSSKTKIAEFLNRNGIVPMSHEWLIDTINYCKQPKRKDECTYVRGPANNAYVYG